MVGFDLFFFALSLSCQYPGPRIMTTPVGCVFAYWDVRSTTFHDQWLGAIFPLHVPSPSIGSLAWMDWWSFWCSSHQDLHSHKAIFWKGIDFPMIYILIFYPIAMKNYMYVHIFVMICASKFFYQSTQKWHNSNWAMPIFPGACAGDARLSGGAGAVGRCFLFSGHSFVFYWGVQLPLLIISFLGSLKSGWNLHPICSK